VLDFLRDYASVFPIAVAVLNSALAAITANYPFKSTGRKLVFMAIVLSLSFVALAAAGYSQYLITVQRNVRMAIHDKLSDFIDQGNKIFDQCNEPPPQSDVKDWIHNVEDFLAAKVGKSYLSRFREITTATPSAILPQCNLYFDMYPRLSRLQQFSQEFSLP
jgi:hypothetical protein